MAFVACIAARRKRKNHDPPGRGLRAVGGGPAMIDLRPIHQAEAFAFVREHHRHHNVPVGSLWQHAVHDDSGVLRGVAVVGRPVARKLDDGFTCEVTRLCTDGADNACSMLYAASWRAAQAKGYRRIISYILISESGLSLEAASWVRLYETGGGSWSRPSRQRDNDHPLERKVAYGRGAWREITVIAA